MTIIGWILVGLYSLTLSIEIFHPLRKNRKDEVVQERILGLIVGGLALFYILHTLLVK